MKGYMEQENNMMLSIAFKCKARNPTDKNINLIHLQLKTFSFFINKLIKLKCCKAKLNSIDN